MKISFSTLACPDWTLDKIIEIAVQEGFQGIELRFIEQDDRLWQRPEFVGPGLAATRSRLESAGLKIPCVDTSCFFHYPDAVQRCEALEMGKAMMGLAAELGAPGIRVFGDRVQPGMDRRQTAEWIVEGLQALASFGKGYPVEVWLESHGDFAPARESLELLEKAACANLGLLWDPANAYTEFGEEPATGLQILGPRIRHVHIKDAVPPLVPGDNKLWDPVLVGEGKFPAREMIMQLAQSGYSGFVSFEWEKRWHPEIPDPAVALPHFMNWVRAGQHGRS